MSSPPFSAVLVAVIVVERSAAWCNPHSANVATAENAVHTARYPRRKMVTGTSGRAAACRRCNAKKMDRTPQEAGFHLHRQPFAPSDGFRLTLGQVEPGWEPYLI